MHESDIRPVDLLAEYLRLNDEDGRRLLANEGSLKKFACPGCGGENSTAAFDKNGFALVRCTNCDTLYVNPAPFGPALEQFYDDSPSANYWANVFLPAVAAARRSKIYRPRAERVLAIAADLNGAADTLVDVGAGAGLFLQELKRLSPKMALLAIEPNKTQSVKLREDGFKVYEGYAETAAAEPDIQGRADIVTCFEVLEHVGQPLNLFNALSALVRPGGLIIVSGLSGSGFDIQVLGAGAKPVSPPHHLTFLSTKGAARLMQRSGLETLSITTPGELDVDIVRNAALEDPNCLDDAFLRHLVLDADDKTRAAFQTFLKDNMLSSHMWIVARRPEQEAPAP